MNYLYSTPFTPGNTKERLDAIKNLINEMVKFIIPNVIQDEYFTLEESFTDSSNIEIGHYTYTFFKGITIGMENGSSSLNSPNDDRFYLRLESEIGNYNFEIHSEETASEGKRYKIPYTSVRNGAVYCFLNIESNGTIYIHRIVLREIAGETYVAHLRNIHNSSSQSSQIFTTLFLPLYFDVYTIEHPNAVILMPYKHQIGVEERGLFYAHTPLRTYYDINVSGEHIAIDYERIEEINIDRKMYEVIQTDNEKLNLCMEI